MTKTYELVNMQGCKMGSVEADSFQKAREYFASRYTGSYKLIDMSNGSGKIKNVRL